VSGRPGRPSSSSTVQFLYDRYVGEDGKRIEEFGEVALNAGIARKIYDLRTKAGLSQRELAKRAGTSASAVCLEGADYDGHSLSLLKSKRTRAARVGEGQKLGLRSDEASCR